MRLSTLKMASRATTAKERIGITISMKSRETIRNMMTSLKIKHLKSRINSTKANLIRDTRDIKVLRRVTISLRRVMLPKMMPTLKQTKITLNTELKSLPTKLLRKSTKKSHQKLSTRKKLGMLMMSKIMEIPMEQVGNIMNIQGMKKRVTKRAKIGTRTVTAKKPKCMRKVMRERVNTLPSIEI
jgi:hypothetical protein